ncbi:MAG: 1-acyl-sn-glycerol-3-phosphate acyltransferase [Firmicutes bacterium]|nr:1-acyl-sn-glycerol-3-phosphate acyltransferase [Bacillota bacterium]
MIQKIKINQPAIALSNHTSFYDFIYTTAALYPNRVSYLAANKMFYDPLLGPFLRLARAIPKSLFQPDPAATLKAFKILKKGGLVSVFPEGQISPYGKSLVPAFSIAKFLRKAGVDVYTVIHHNAYFVNPPWSKKTFRGKIETKMELIISKETLSTLNDQQIYDIVVDKIYFNASEYNEEKKYTYKLNNIANLENVIYQCPKCSYEGLVADKDHLHCPQCSTDLKYDQYGKIGGYSIDYLFGIQEKTVQNRILNHPEFVLSHQVKLESFRNNRVVEVGYGKLTLNPKAYTFEGVIDGKPESLVFDIKNVSTLPSDIGINVQIYEGNQLYQFIFKDRKLPTMYVHAGEFIYQQYKNSL